MRILNAIALAALLLCAPRVEAQTPNPPTVRVIGRVIDPAGAVIPEADVRLLQGTTTAVEGKTDSSGNFALDAAAGEYRLEVTVGDAFAPVRQAVRVTPNMGRMTVSMKLAAVNTNVDVGADTGQVSIDSDASLTSTALSQDQINALPDDEDQLLAQLQEIAGASGAANSTAGVVVDGFTGGRVPPRDQIQQIIIDTNTFSAEGTGGPRIQIITKPGTGPWSGSITTGFADAAFNARNPFDTAKLARRQHILQTSYGGPVIPGKLTLRFTGRTVQQDTQNDSVLAVLPNGSVKTGVFTPVINRSLSLTGQLYFTANNTLNFTGNYNTNATKNQGIGGFTLPERATNFKGHNWNVQFIERAIISSKLTNEARLFYFHNQNSQLPITEGIAINVLDAFNSGGAQNRTRRRGTSSNFGNTARWAVRPTLNLQLGTDFTYNDNYSSSETNYFGTFTFSSLDDYIAGRPIQFRKTTGNPVVDVQQWEFAAFVQADWRVNPKMNVGVGVRYQAQTHLRDFNNVAPTFQVAYQFHPKTVVRAGARLTYQVYFIGNTEQLIRQNGTTNQIETVILNPATFPDDPTLSATGITTGVNSGSIRTRADDLAAPYNVNAAATLEQTLPGGWRGSASVDVTRGVHVIRTRNINAPFPGTPLSDNLFARLNSPDPSIQAIARNEVDLMRPFYPVVGNINQYEASGSSFSRNLNLKIIPPTTLRLFGIGVGGQAQYTLGWARDDASAENQYDWRSEWAPSSFDTRHRFQSFLNLTLPRATTLAFNILANSGRPYTITTGRDNNGDQNTNDRPAGGARNAMTGPGNYNVNMNFTKTFQLRGLETPGSGGAPQILVNGAPPPPGAVILGGPGGGIPTGPAPSGPRLVFNVGVNNLLNHTQLRGYSGVLTSPLFGKPTGAASGRSMNLGLSFNW